MIGKWVRLCKKAVLTCFKTVCLKRLSKTAKNFSYGRLTQ